MVAPAYTLTRPRTRADTILARAWVVVRRHAPTVGRWLARSGARLRQLVLYLGGLGSLVYAAFLLSAALGFVALGVSLLLLEFLSAPEAGTRR